MLLTLLSPQGSGLAYYDRADALSRHKLLYDEETIAAQLLKARQSKKRAHQVIKKAIEWKTLFIEKINGVETVEQLDAIVIPTIKTESVETTAAILAEIQKSKEQKRIQLEIAKREAELKVLELQTEAASKEANLIARIQEQQQALESAKNLQIQVLERYQMAINAAIELERKAFEEAKIAEEKANEFNRKRTQRINRLKSLMWLAGLDL
jgi:hypothetical protein